MTIKTTEGKNLNRSNKMELINNSNNQFVEISSEEYRQYIFPGTPVVKHSDDAIAYPPSHTDLVMIFEPLYLSVSPGGHRILDAKGISHFIPKGWIHLKWKAKEGKPHFVK